MFTSLLLWGLLVACSGKAPAPVYDISSNSSVNGSKFSTTTRANIEIPEEYTVLAGDTLYSIAWQYSLDHHELIRINQLKNSTIFPGQKLKLSSKEEQKYFDSSSLLAALNREILSKPVTKNKKLNNSSRRKSQSKPKKVRNNSKNNKLASKQANNEESKRVLTSVKKRSKNNFNWIWPANGKILSRFSAKSNESRGLDIAGAKGQPVRATAPGRVVYQGSGLRGYGKLIIIKHDDDYLSAYAHNDKVHVSENEAVKAGQRIADIGSSGANRTKLHFEIRYKGKPVDPLNYLPERKL